MIRPLFLRRLLMVTVLSCPFVAAVQQNPAATPSKPASTQSAGSSAKAATQTAPAAPKIEPEPDDKAYQAAQRIADPMERADALIKFVHDFPQYPYIRGVVAYLFRNPVKSPVEQQANAPADPQLTASIVDKFMAGTATAPAYARAEFDSGIAKYLLDKDVLLPRAVEIARAAIPLLNEADYVANEQRKLDRSVLIQQKRTGTKVTAGSISVEDVKVLYRAFAASVHGTLGRALVKSGDLDGAQQAFHHAYEIEPALDAAIGMADIAEKRGDATATLNYLMDAYLTGHMTAKDIQRLNEAWAKQHDGKEDGLQAALDARFHEHFSSPLHPDKYVAPANRSHRVALAEYITGAGCLPCTSVDVAFDAVLKRYSREELALIVYHTHAPASDPMSNFSAEDRLMYYGIHGAPSVFLDGARINPGAGLKTQAERVFGNLDKTLQQELARAEEAAIDLDAHLEKGNVKVTAAVKNVNASGRNLRLQIALVENEIGYSGENGVRFHPMVVRSLAYPRGFSLGTLNQTDYTFNLSRVTNENLAYYDWYIDDLYSRVQLRTSFKEKRYKIDEHNLSVVAFLQDDATKQVLQAAYVKISPEPAKPSGTGQ